MVCEPNDHLCLYSIQLCADYIWPLKHRYKWYSVESELRNIGRLDRDAEQLALLLLA